MNRLYAPSPTVRASIVPFYLRGGQLGQDDSGFDFTPPEPTIPDFAPPDITPPDIFPGGVPDLPDLTDVFGSVDFTTAPLTDQGFTPDEADLINAAAANGLIDEQQFQSILSGNHSYEEISNMIFSGSRPTTAPAQQSVAQRVAAGAKKAADAVKAATGGGGAAKPSPAPGSAPRVATSPPGQAPVGTSFWKSFTSPSPSGFPSPAMMLGGGLIIVFALSAMGGRR